MHKLLRRLGRTFAGSVHAARLTSRMDEEMQFHVDMATAKKIREGLAPDEARRRALVEFGARQRFREESRDEFRSRPFADLSADVRVAARSTLLELQKAGAYSKEFLQELQKHLADYRAGKK